MAINGFNGSYTIIRLLFGELSIIDYLHFRFGVHSGAVYRSEKLLYGTFEGLESP